MKRKELLLSAAVVGSIIVVATLVWGPANFYGEAQMAAEFDKQRWNDDISIHQEPYPRRQMVDDVMTNHLAVGQSRAEVIERLGEPTDTPYFKDFDLVYWLGAEKGYISVDSLWLVIKLDAEGRVSQFELAND